MDLENELKNELTMLYEADGIRSLVLGCRSQLHAKLRTIFGKLEGSLVKNSKKYPNGHAVRLLGIGEEEVNEYMGIPVLSYDCLLGLIAELRNIIHTVPPDYGFRGGYFEDYENSENKEAIALFKKKVKDLNNTYTHRISVRSIPNLVTYAGKTWKDVLKHFNMEDKRTFIGGQACKSDAEVKKLTDLELRGFVVSTSGKDIGYPSDFMENTEIYKRRPYFDALVTTPLSGIEPFYVEIWGNMDWLNEGLYSKKKAEKIAYHKKHGIRILCVDWNCTSKDLEIAFIDQLGIELPPILPEYENIPILYYGKRFIGPQGGFITEKDKQQFLDECRKIQQSQKDKLLPLDIGKHKTGIFSANGVEIFKYDIRKFYRCVENLRLALGESQDMIDSMKCWSSESETKIKYLSWWKDNDKGRIQSKKSFIEKDEISQNVPPKRYNIGACVNQWRENLKNKKKQKNSMALYLSHRLKVEGLENLILEGQGNFSHKPDLLTYKEAIEFIAPNKFNVVNDYMKYARENPAYNLPIIPAHVYSNEWKDWKEFLGSDFPPSGGSGNMSEIPDDGPGFLEWFKKHMMPHFPDGEIPPTAWWEYTRKRNPTRKREKWEQWTPSSVIKKIGKYGGLKKLQHDVLL